MASVRDRMQQAIARRAMIVADRDAKARTLESLKTGRVAIDEAQVLIQKAAVVTQDGLRSRFESIVQSCLDAVFPHEYVFHMDFVARKGATEVDISLEPLNGVKDGDDRRMDPRDANGGGIMDIIALGLRMACLTLSGSRRTLVLDEPFKMIRQEPRKRLGEVVNAMARKLGVQVIMVADVGGTGIVPDRVFKVSKGADGRSAVKTCEPEATKV